MCLKRYRLFDVKYGSRTFTCTSLMYHYEDVLADEKANPKHIEQVLEMLLSCPECKEETLSKLKELSHL